MQILSFSFYEIAPPFSEDGKRNYSFFDCLPVMNLLFSHKLGAFNHLSVYFEPSILKKGMNALKS